jgi:hypothetical protein
MMAVQLNEEPLLIEALESVPYASLGLVSAGLAASYVPRLLQVARTTPTKNWGDRFDKNRLIGQGEVERWGDG